MTPAKRVFDILVCLCLVAVLAVPMVMIVALIWIKDGRPILYVSERMSTPTKAFLLVKFRTMMPSAENSGVSGGEKSGRITNTGKFLRRTRLDELPQLWNVLVGDISFVGPRPPLREYVDQFPETYAAVLKSRPGVTGLASVHYHAAEERILGAARSAAETDLLYTRRCIPRKARIDLLYQANQSLCLDMAIMLRTVFGRRK